eukprot:g3163.t1
MKDPIPRFDGKVSAFAVFLAQFIDYALLNVKGVDTLHALEDVQDHTTWYPVQEHTGTGATYHVIPPDGDGAQEHDPTYEEQVAAAGLPAYPDEATAAQKTLARRTDKKTRKLLAAALRVACANSSTAMAALQNSDRHDGVSGLLTLHHKFATQRVNVNRSVALRTAMWSEEWSSGSIAQFLERVEQRIKDCRDNGVAVSQEDKYAAILGGIERTDKQFAAQLKGAMAGATAAAAAAPYDFITDYLSKDFADFSAGDTYTALLARATKDNVCQICGEIGHVAKTCKSRAASAAAQVEKRPQGKRSWGKSAAEKKADGTYVPTPEYNKRRRNRSNDRNRNRDDHNDNAQYAEFVEISHGHNQNQRADLALLAQAAAGAEDGQLSDTNDEFAGADDHSNMRTRSTGNKAVPFVCAALVCLASVLYMAHVLGSAHQFSGARHVALMGQAITGDVPKQRLVPLAFNGQVPESLSAELNGWVLDSGATDHFAMHYDAFDPKAYVPLPQVPENAVRVGNNDSVAILGRGDIPALIKIHVADGPRATGVPTKTYQTVVGSAKHTPGMAKNLFSVKKAWSKNHDIVLSKRLGNFVQIGNVKIPVNMDGNLPMIEIITGPRARAEIQAAFNANTVNAGDHAGPAAVGAEFDTKWENSITFSLGVGINQCDNADGTRTVAIDMSDSIEELAYAYDVVDGNFRPVDNPAEANAKYHEWIASSDDEHEEVLGLGLRSIALLNPANGTVVVGDTLQIRFSVLLPETPPEQQERVVAEAHARLRVCFALDGQRSDDSACTALSAGDVTMDHLLPGRRRLEATVRDSAGGGGGGHGASVVLARAVSEFRVRYASADGSDDQHNIDFYAHRGAVAAGGGDASGAGDGGGTGGGGGGGGGESKEFRSRFFDGVYRFSVWAGGLKAQQQSEVPGSGPGSTLASTRSIRAALPEIVRAFGVRALLDVPCGDMSWMPLVNLSGVRYVGADISPRVVERNQRRLAQELELARGSRLGPPPPPSPQPQPALLGMRARSVDFRVLDLVEDTLPRGVDVLFMRHLMFHLTPAHNLRVLRAVQASAARYLLASTYLRTDVNREPFVLVEGHHINLLRPPYCLRDPLRLYAEDHHDMYMGLWDLQATDERGARLPLLGSCEGEERVVLYRAGSNGTWVGQAAPAPGSA